MFKVAENVIKIRAVKKSVVPDVVKDSNFRKKRKLSKEFKPKLLNDNDYWLNLLNFIISALNHGPLNAHDLFYKVIDNVKEKDFSNTLAYGSISKLIVYDNSTLKWSLP